MNNLGISFPGNLALARELFSQFEGKLGTFRFQSFSYKSVWKIGILERKFDHAYFLANLEFFSQK